MATKNIDKREDLIRTLSNLVEELRSPLANLRAAAENLSTHPDISPVMRSAFENIILQESTILSDAFQTLVDTSKQALQSTRHHAILSSSALMDSLCIKTNPGSDCTVSCNGPSCDLVADKDALLFLLDFFIKKIRKDRDTSTISCEITPAKTHIYIDLVWQGSPFSPTELESWQTEEIQITASNRTVAAILKEHDSEIWSSTSAKNKKLSLLRIPLPTSNATLFDTTMD